MIKLFRFTILSIFLITFTTCKKRVHKEHPEYIGTWVEVYNGRCRVTLIIDEKSRGSYSNHYGGSEECGDQFVGIVKIDYSKLRVAWCNFKIVEGAREIPPITFIYGAQSNAIPDTCKWKMVLEQPYLLGGRDHDTIALYKVENP